MSAGRILEARAIISGDDKLSPVLEKIEARIQSIAKMSRELGRVAGTVSSTASSVAALDGVSQAERALGHLGSVLTRLSGDADRAAKALGQASRAARAASDKTPLTFDQRLGKDLKHTVHSVSPLVLGGAGLEVTHGVKEAALAGAKRQHQRVQMANAGMSEAEIAESEQVSMSAARGAPNLDVSEIMELHKEARSAVQHPREALELLPMLSKAASVLKGMGVANANIAEIVKAGESLGLMNDPKRFEKYLSGQIKAMAVMGKTINTEQVYESAKYSKAAGSTLSDRFLNTTMPSLIQEMHGSSAGDALSMMNRTLRGGLQHKHLPVERLNEIGMLEDPSKIRRSKTGEIMGYKGKVVGDSLLASDPDKFAKVLDQHMEAHGIKKYEDKVKFLYETLPSTAANLMRIFLQQRETLEQHARNYEAAPDLDKAALNQREDATAALGALGKSLESFAGTLASPIMRDAATTMSNIATKVSAWGDSLAAWQKANPETAKLLAGGAIVGGLGAGGALGVTALTGLASGFGLKASAVALDASAAALTAAAAKQATGGLPGLPEGKKSGKYGRRLLGAAKAIPIIGALIEAAEVGLDYVHDKELPPGPSNPTGAHGFKQPMVRRPNPADPIVDKAHAAKTALDAVDQAKVAPQADTSALDGMLAKISAVLAGLRSISGAATSAQSAVRGINANPMNLGQSAPGTGPAGRTPSGK